MVFIMVNENNEKKNKESLHERSERHAIYVIIDAVFGLSLGLGAFSLTELPIANTHDLLVAIGFFGFSYFIIFMSWMIIRRYFGPHCLWVYKWTFILHRLFHRHFAYTDTHNIDAVTGTHFIRSTRRSVYALPHLLECRNDYCGRI